MRSAVCAALVVLLAAGCSDSGRPRPGSTTEPTPTDAAFLWYETQPRVVTPGTTDSLRITVAVEGTPASVRIQTRTGGLATLPRVAAGLHALTVPATALLFGYRSGDLHYVAGVIVVTSEGGASTQHNLLINVRDATVPLVNTITIASGIQATDRVVNIRYDDLVAGNELPPALLRRFYENFPDDYTFAAVIPHVMTLQDPLFHPVRNSIRGLGIPLFDNGSTFGSPARLEGVITYATDVLYDPAETNNLHELGHRWLNYATLPSLASGRPHWPLSTLAAGIMGLNGNQDQRLPFPFTLTRQGTDSYLVQIAEVRRTFNDLELYYMGLLPADSVQAHIVFLDQNQATQLRQNGVLTGPLDTVTVAKIVARDGARVPASGPRQFKLATIVLSRNGLLSRSEMSFFEHMAARGEATSALAFNTGVTAGETLPFLPATGGRASLITRLQGGTTTN